VQLADEEERDGEGGAGGEDDLGPLRADDLPGEPEVAEQGADAAVGGPVGVDDGGVAQQVARVGGFERDPGDLQLLPGRAQAHHLQQVSAR
jgi:hypothetical protein